MSEDLIAESATTATVLKTASYTGALTSIVSALTLTDWGIIIGIITALLTFGLNAWWVIRKVRKLDDSEKREIEEHEARMKQLGFSIERHKSKNKQSGKVSPKLISLLGGGALLTAAGLITHWESGNNRPTQAYQDMVGVWTICDGITRGVTKGMKATQDQCDDKLYKELKIYAGGVDKCLLPTVSENARAAIISLAWNVGTKGACGSTAVRKLNQGDLKGGCDALLLWSYAGGKQVQGLLNRRKAERDVCLRADQ